MKLLDRYLLRQFVQIFAICFLSLMGLYVVIDAFGHLDSLSSQVAQEGSLLNVLIKYYGYQSLSFFDRTSGILAMLAAMFTVIWLQKHQEFTAMLAAGISKFRIIKPLVVAGLAVSLLGVANRELLIPRVRDEITRERKDLAGQQVRDLESRFDGQTNILIGGESTLAAEKKIVKPAFILPPQLSDYGKRLVAEEAFYLEATTYHPAGYLLDEVISPARIGKLQSLNLGDRQVVITPADASWLEADQVFVVSQLSFHLLSSGSAWRNYASTGELITELASPSTDLGANVQVAVHTRLLQPAMDATLMMLGLPLMFSRRQRNIFLSIGICLFVAVSFLLVALTCQSMGGLNLLRPTLAAWLPLMLFLPLAVALSHNFRT